MPKDLENKKEPTLEEVKKHMKEKGLDYYNARESLRKRIYGEKIPHGFASWGDYWKSY